jgi:hypothetical protein
MARLPQPGADNDAWGQLLNDFLLVEHREDGTHRSGIFNALTFGAKGDGVTDDTAAIQATLDAAAACGGVAWLAPSPAFYRCQGTLTVPPNVTLRGGFGGMRRGHKLWNGDQPCGSVLYAYSPNNFITMSHNSTVDGIEIFYPEQVTAGEPRPYGWTIVIPRQQHGVTVRNVTCPNPYQFLFAEADGLWVDGVQGYPLYKGIKLGRIGDVARVGNIQFNPNVLPRLDMSLRNWVQVHGSCLEIDGAEEFMVNNFFGYGYVCGIWFTGHATQGELPGSYGSISNFGFDSVTVGILVGTKGVSGRQGVSLSNGRIIPFAGEVGARAGIKFVDDVGADPGSNPAVSLTNVSFFGDHERSVWIGPRSGARLTMLGGQSTEYRNEAVLVESPNAAVRLIGVRTFNGSGPRIQNPGNADVDDLGGM